MNERPLAAATVSPLRVRLDAESEQVRVARLACSTIGGVMNPAACRRVGVLLRQQKKEQTQRLAKPRTRHRAVRNHLIEKPQRSVANRYRLMARSICALGGSGAVCIFDINFMTRRAVVFDRCHSSAHPSL